MSSNSYLKIKKVATVFLIIALTYCYVLTIGTYTMQSLISYATNDEEQMPKVVAKEEVVTNTVTKIKEEEKRIVQEKVTTGIYEEEFPIKTTKLELKKDVLKDYELEEVMVTKLNQNSFTQGSWVVSDDKIIVTLENDNEELSEKEQGLDELLVTYVFKIDEEDDEELDNIPSIINNVEITMFSGEELEEKPEKTTVEVERTKTPVLNVSVYNKDIHKTSMEDDTVYQEKLSINLSYRNGLNSFSVEDKSTIFYNNKEEELENDGTKYLKTTINKEDLLEILGEDGKLYVLDGKTILAEITKEKIESIEEDEVIPEYFEVEKEDKVEKEIRSFLSITDDFLEVKYVNDTDTLAFAVKDVNKQNEESIKTSNLIIENTKIIFDVQDIDSLACLKEAKEFLFINEDESKIEEEIESTINFKDTVTRASLEIDNNEWTVDKTNNVEYKITLDTTSENAELFSNPVLILELPDSVDSINSAKSEFTVENDGDVFEDKNVNIVNLLGKKYIVTTLTGEQTEESIENGNTIINLNLSLNIQGSAEENQSTRLFYMNNTITSYESGAGFDTDEVEIVLQKNIEEVVGKANDDNDNTDSTTAETTSTQTEESDEEIEPSGLEVLVFSSEGEIIRQNKDYTYNINLSNYSLEEKQNIQIQDILPEEITLTKVVKVVEEEEEEINYDFDDSTRTITVNIDSIDAATQEAIDNEEDTNVENDDEIVVPNYLLRPTYLNYKLYVKANELENNVYSKELSNKVNVLLNDTIVSQNQCNDVISDVFLDCQVDELNETINEKKDVILKLSVKNNGLLNSENTNLKIQLPTELEISNVKASAESNGSSTTLFEDTLSNYTFERDMNILSNQTIHIEVTGTAKDVDKDTNITINGSLDDNITFSWDTVIKDIPVENPNTQEETNENVPSSVINTNGSEDTNNDNENSTKPNEDNNEGNTPNKGNSPSGNDNSARDNKKFDLSLNQYIDKIKVVNSNGTTEYSYSDTQFAKVEIHAKEMNDSVVTIDYTIIVKNEGTIPGYVRKIANYLPTNVTFDAESNPDWYLGDDGNIYSVKFIDKLLQPGETIELQLELTKKMSNDSAGSVSSIAEIYEASNEINFVDVNSTPGNKKDGENDMSKAEVLIAVKTGSTMLYILLVVTVLVILGFGTYKINKQVISSRKGGC